MGYKVYVKDKTSGRYEQWSRKTHGSRVRAIGEAEELRNKYKKPSYKKLYGTPQVSIRKVGSTSRRNVFGGFKF